MARITTKIIFSVVDYQSKRVDNISKKIGEIFSIIFRILSIGDFYANMFSIVADNVHYFPASCSVPKRNNFQTSAREIHSSWYLSDKFRHFLRAGHISLITKY